MFSLNPLERPPAASWAARPHKELEERVTARQPPLTSLFYAKVGESLDLTFVPGGFRQTDKQTSALSLRAGRQI